MTLEPKSVRRANCPLRVFLSYGHADLAVCERVALALEAVGHVPVWDKEIAPGSAFPEAIRKQIATAHIFMPLLTQHSVNRPWIHQEIGFALGIDVPVIPVTVGVRPGEMIAELQALTVKKDLTNLASIVGQVDFEQRLLSRESQSGFECLASTVQIADSSERRTDNLVVCARGVRKPARIRQRAIVSSFSWPDADPADHSWNTIDPQRHWSDYHRQLLRDERRVLDDHVRTGGCSLILGPLLEDGVVAAPVYRQHLELVVAFLQSVREDQVTVAIAQTSTPGNLTLVGDWFGIRALTPRPGSEYHDTIFCQHGPTLFKWQREFDEQLVSILNQQNVGPRDSLKHATTLIQNRLARLTSDRTARTEG